MGGPDGAGEAGERRLSFFSGFAQPCAPVLLPVAGILAVAGEWSQRIVLTTFALESR